MRAKAAIINARFILIDFFRVMFFQKNSGLYLISVIETLRLLSSLYIHELDSYGILLYRITSIFTMPANQCVVELRRIKTSE